MFSKLRKRVLSPKRGGNKKTADDPSSKVHPEEDAEGPGAQDAENANIANPHGDEEPEQSVSSSHSDSNSNATTSSSYCSTSPTPTEEASVSSFSITQDENENEVISYSSDEKFAKSNTSSVTFSDVLALPDPVYFKPTDVTVFPFFTDIARFLGLKRRAKVVHFPEEVVKKAEAHGETSPDSLNISRTKFPYKAFYSSKKNQVLQVSRVGEFKPKIAWIENTSKCEARCERMITNCRCFATFQDPRTILREKAKKDLARKSRALPAKRPKLTKATSSFMYHVNKADRFLIDHKTKTLAGALEDVDGIPPRTAEGLRQTTYLLKIHQNSPSPKNSKSILKPTNSKEFYVDELPPLSLSKLGRLAAHIWTFAVAVPLLFSNPEDLPKESSYRRLMSEFAGLALSANESAVDLIQQSKDFYSYAAEAVRVIRNLQLKIYLEGENGVKRPIKMGKGLALGKRGPPFQIQVQLPATSKKASKDDLLTDEDEGEDAQAEAPQFRNFEELSSNQKMLILNSLILTTLQEFDHAKRQIDFLVDDVKETTYDMENQSDLLYQLSELYNCMTAISHEQYVHPSFKIVEEFTVICEVLSKFILSLNSFITGTQHIIEKVMEVRDIIQVTYLYFQETLELDHTVLIPPDHPIRFMSKMGMNYKRRGCWGKMSHCCGSGSGSSGAGLMRRNSPTLKKEAKKRKSKAKLKKYKVPSYSGPDLFRVRYEELFNMEDIKVEGYSLRVRPLDTSDGIGCCATRIPTPYKKKEVNIHFRHSKMKTSTNYLSPGSLTSIASADDPFGLRSPSIPEETVLKPILKDTPTNLTPVTSQTTIEVLKAEEKKEAAEEDEEEDTPEIEDMKKRTDSIILKKVKKRNT